MRATDFPLARSAVIAMACRVVNFVLSFLVLAIFGFVLGAFLIWRKGGPKKQAVLMLILAAVAAANIAIWTIPDKNGTSPLIQPTQSGGR